MDSCDKMEMLIPPEVNKLQIVQSTECQWETLKLQREFYGVRGGFLHVGCREYVSGSQTHNQDVRKGSETMVPPLLLLMMPKGSIMGLLILTSLCRRNSFIELLELIK